MKQLLGTRNEPSARHRQKTRVACMCQQGSPGVHVTSACRDNSTPHQRLYRGCFKSFNDWSKARNAALFIYVQDTPDPSDTFATFRMPAPIPAGLSSRPSLHPRVLGGANKTVLHRPKLQAWQGPEMMRSHTNLDCRRAARGLALLLTCWTEQAVRKKFEPFLAP